ncbi:MAG: WG repeat-containing protein [Armatimonadota bacterium]
MSFEICKSNGMHGIKSKLRDEWILPPEYTCITELRILFAQLYLVNKSNLYGIYQCDDNAQEWAIEPVYDSIEQIEGDYGNFFLVRSHSNYGLYYNDSITFKVLDCCCKEINIEKLAVGYAVKADNSIGIYHGKKWILEKEYNSISSLEDKKFLVEKADLYGIIDVNEYAGSYEWILPLQYECIKSISDAIVEVLFNNKHGLFTTSGEEILECKYNSIAVDVYYSQLTIQADGKSGIYNYQLLPEYRWIMQLEYESITKLKTAAYSDCYIVGKDRLFGVVKISNYSASWVIQPEYDDITLQCGDYFLVRRDSKYGLYNLHGSIIFEPRFNNITVDKQDNLLFVNADNKIGLYLNDRWVLEPEYDSIALLAKKYYRISRNGLHGVIRLDETSSTQIIEPIYDAIELINNDYFKLVFGSRCGLCNRDGDLILECKYNTVSIEHNDNGDNIHTDDKAGLYLNGIWLLEPSYETISKLSDNLYKVTLNGKHGLLHVSGNKYVKPRHQWLLPVEYGDISIDRPDHAIFETKGHLILVKAGEYFGIIDECDHYPEVILTPMYKRLSIEEMIYQDKYENISYDVLDGCPFYDFMDYSLHTFIGDDKVGILSCRKDNHGVKYNSIFKPAFDDIQEIEHPYYLVKCSDKVGLVEFDKVGNLLLDVLYDSIVKEDDLFIVTGDSGSGVFYDKHWIMQPKHKSIPAWKINSLKSLIRCGLIK